MTTQQIGKAVPASNPHAYQVPRQSVPSQSIVGQVIGLLQGVTLSASDARALHHVIDIRSDCFDPRDPDPDPADVRARHLAARGLEDHISESLDVTTLADPMQRMGVRPGGPSFMDHEALRHRVETLERQVAAMAGTRSEEIEALKGEVADERLLNADRMAKLRQRATHLEARMDYHVAIETDGPSPQPSVVTPQSRADIKAGTEKVVSDGVASLSRYQTHLFDENGIDLRHQGTQDQIDKLCRRVWELEERM